jgi:hypothetical protein
MIYMEHIVQNSWNEVVICTKEIIQNFIRALTKEFYQSSMCHVIFHQCAMSSSTKHPTKMHWLLIIAARHVILH